MHVVFTYMGDPSTTLTVNWQTLSSVPGDPVVYYDTTSRSGGSGEYAHRVEGKVFQIDHLDGRQIYRVQLTQLQPGTTYYVLVESTPGSPSTEFKVRTIPDDDTPLRFVTGGDMGVTPETQLLLRHSATYSPAIAVLGGDISYANGKTKNVNKWDAWLTYYTEEMVTPEGFTIPMVLAIGNHEVAGHYDKTKEEAPFFFGLFGQDEDRSYFVRKFGRNLSLFVLDSSHVATHESQAGWLREQLAAHADVKYKAAVYHIPLYPSHRPYSGKRSELGRVHWAPLFDEYGLTVAFENHDHALKRSHPLKAGEIAKDGEGTLYLGDGCFGRSARPVSYGGRWYLDESAGIQHFWVVDMGREQAVYRAVDIDNQMVLVHPKSEAGVDLARQRKSKTSTTFLLPQSAVVCEGYSGVGEVWTGGETRVTLRNPFEWPVQSVLHFKDPKKKIEAVDLPHDPITIAPGESHTFDVTFRPMSGETVLSDGALIVITVRYTMSRPPPERALVFTDAFNVPVRR